MARTTRPGAVIFTGNKDRLAQFYEAVTGLAVQTSDPRITVLASEDFELVIHALPGEPPPGPAPEQREAYVKPFFPVRSLSETRLHVEALGGRIGDQWSARGFRACEAIDPDGNPIQFREEGP